jgi:hypothetical protein
MLQPLPIPSSKWESIEMNFITQLPCTKQEHDYIFFDMKVIFVMSNNMGDQSLTTWIRAGSGAARGGRGPNMANMAWNGIHP